MSKVSFYLILAGLIPFLGLTFCLVFGITALPILGSTVQVLGLYSLIIAVFISGSHWGQHLTLDDQWAIFLPITSNLITVILWLVFLLCSFKVITFLFVFVFVILLGIDFKLLKTGHISSHYFRMRFIVTAIVCLMLVITGFFHD